MGAVDLDGLQSALSIVKLFFVTRFADGLVIKIIKEGSFGGFLNFMNEFMQFTRKKGAKSRDMPNVSCIIYFSKFTVLITTH